MFLCLSHIKLVVHFVHVTTVDTHTHTHTHTHTLVTLNIMPTQLESLYRSEAQFIKTRYLGLIYRSWHT